MTTYSSRSVNGNAAEYLVAYTVTRKLGWPCRLYGVDLGVDAEMEVMLDGQTDGDIIKIQVKGFDDVPGDTKSVYVDERHIRYWQRFSSPVIVCCVDLTGEKVFWKAISATEAYQSSGNARRLDFNPKNDLLDGSSKEALAALVSPPAAKDIGRYLNEIHAFVADPSNDGHRKFDYKSISDLEAGARQMLEEVSRVEQIARDFPWRLGLTDRGFLEKARARLIRIVSDCAHQHASLLNGG
jgi:hypothetical protein